MTSREEVKDGEPKLGYVSLAQLQEFAIQSQPDRTKQASRFLASRTFLAAVRLGLPVIQAVEIDPEADRDTFGWPKLINADALQRSLDAGDLTRPRPDEFDEGLIPTYIGAKGVQLTADFIDERVQFLGGQQG